MMAVERVGGRTGGQNLGGWVKAENNETLLLSPCWETGIGMVLTTRFMVITLTALVLRKHGTLSNYSSRIFQISFWGLGRMIGSVAH
jgi:hypothetical protein